MLRGRLRTWVFIALGVVVVFIGPLVEPITLDNLRWHLYVTGLGAAILGLGLGRSSLGRE